MTQLIASLKELTDVKLALDAEIATYRRLLMAEDGRLDLVSTLPNRLTNSFWLRFVVHLLHK